MTPKPTSGKTDITLVCQGMNGGVGPYTHNMYKGLREKGCKVHLVCRHGDLLHLEDHIHGSDVFVLSSLDYRKGVSGFARYMEANQPKVIVTPQLRPTITALRARAAINSRTKIFPVIHNTYSRELNRLKLSKRFFRMLRLRYYYPKCDGIVAVSAGVAADFTKMIGISESAVSVLYNPLDTGGIQAKASQPLDHPWFTKDQPPVVLGIGRLDWQKNFQLLIEAFERIRSSIASRLMILGDGPERGKLERRVHDSPFSEDIALPGHVSNPYPYLKRSALFILSSNYEGLGYALLEALATGTPVVSTDCPSGPREILMDGRYGQIVPLNDPDTLAKAMVQTINSPLPHEMLQARASEFGISSSVENYLQLFGLTGEN